MTPNHDPADMLDAAYGYVDRCEPWPLFPADARTKRPLIPTGRDHAEHASTDLETIRQWFGERFRGAAIGMPTGAASGAVVLDADRKHDGEELLAALERVIGPLPRTRTVRTQGGGLHIYLAHPGGGVRVKSTAGAHGPLGRLLGGRDGLDVRGDGGIVILPPSLGYRWIADDDEPLPPLPPLWLAAIQGAGEAPRRPRPPRSVRTDDDVVADMLARMTAIVDGARNDTLFRIGVRLRHDGRTESEILDGLERINAALVTPSLSDCELQKIARSAARGTH
jgi:putative DNA primase/helicase